MYEVHNNCGISRRIVFCFGRRSIVVKQTQNTPRVVRGGSWADLARICRFAYRHPYDPGDRNGFLGFRVVAYTQRPVRLVRGGSWNDYARHCRSAYRYQSAPGSRYDSLGFRVISYNSSIKP